MNLPCKNIFITSFATVLFFVIFANPAISSDDDSIPSECYTNMAKIEADAKAYAVKYVQDAVKKHLQAGNVFEAFITAEGSCMKLSLLPEKNQESSINFQLSSTDSNNLGEYQFFTDSLFSLQISPKNVGAKVIKKILANAKRVRLASDNKIVSITSSTGAILKQNRQKEVTVVLTSKSKTVDSGDAVKKISSTKGLSFKDGRYVTNQKYCALKESQLNSLDKSAAQNIRTLKANEIDNHFDPVCSVDNIRKFKNGSLIVYDSICRAEGEVKKTRKSLLKLSEISFKQEGQTFSLCQSSFASQMSTEQIKGFQGALLAMGYDPGKVDGKFKRKTFAAIKQFQTKNKIPVTSRLDKVTYDELLKSAQNLLDVSKTAIGLTPKKMAGQNLKNYTLVTKMDSELEKELNTRALILRKKLIEDPRLLFESVKDGLPTLFAEVLLDKQLRRRFLGSSLPHVACLSENKLTIGYYNVSQHVWAFFWINNKNEIIKGRLSMGLEPTTDPEKTAWFQIQKPDETVKQSMSRAIEIQARAFTMLFWPTLCNLPESKIEYVFSKKPAIAALWGNNYELDKINTVILKKIEWDTYKRNKIKERSDLILSLVMKTDNIPNLNYITIHTNVKNPNIMLIQFWKTDGESLEFIGQNILLPKVREQQ